MFCCIEKGDGATSSASIADATSTRLFGFCLGEMGSSVSCTSFVCMDVGLHFEKLVSFDTRRTHVLQFCMCIGGTFLWRDGLVVVAKTSVRNDGSGGSFVFVRLRSSLDRGQDNVACSYRSVVPLLHVFEAQSGGVAGRPSQNNKFHVSFARLLYACDGRPLHLVVCTNQAQKLHVHSNFTSIPSFWFVSCCSSSIASNESTCNDTSMHTT